MVLKGRIPPEKMFPAGYDGLRQRFIDLPAGRVRVVEAGEANAKPVLLIHGWGGSVYQFRRTMPALAAAGLRPVAIDLKGHGLSDKPSSPESYTTEAMLQWVTQAMDAIGLGKVPVIGHSMGGTLSVHLTERHAGRVEKLVIMDAVGFAGLWMLPVGKVLTPVTPAIVNQVLPYIIGRPFIRLLLWIVHGENKRYGEEDIEQYWAPSQFPGFAYAVRNLVHKFDWTGAANTAALHNIRVPTLVIYGTRDAKAFRKSGDHYARNIPGAQLVRVKGAGHVVHEEASELVNEELWKFLKQK